MLSDSVGVDGADVTTGAADVCGVVDELARVIVVRILRRSSVVATVLVRRGLVAAVLLVMPAGRVHDILLLLLLLLFIIVIHCGRGENNLSIDS